MIFSLIERLDTRDCKAAKWDKIETQGDQFVERYRPVVIPVDQQ